MDPKTNGYNLAKSVSVLSEIFDMANMVIEIYSNQGVKYSIGASPSINTGVETTRSHLAD